MRDKAEKHFLKMELISCSSSTHLALQASYSVRTLPRIYCKLKLNFMRNLGNRSVSLTMQSKHSSKAFQHE